MSNGRKIKKILAGLTAFMIVFPLGMNPIKTSRTNGSSIMTAEAADEIEAESSPSDNFDYIIFDDHVEIIFLKKGSPTNEPLTIPSEIEGLPVTVIRDDTFFNYQSLKSVTIPATVETIGKNVFSYIGIEKIYVEEGNMNFCDVDGVLFDKDMKTLIHFPQRKKEAVYTIPDGVTNISDSAFKFCDRLTEITIPDSVTSIGDGAFSNCSGLTKITLPDSIESIPDKAFYFCTSLSAITIPDSVTSIGDEAFAECENLSEITIPDSVKSIGDSAFEECSSLSSVTLPDSVTSIGDEAFFRCRILSDITLPDSITNIGNGAFAECIKLSAVTLPGSITSIGDGAFSNCTGLSEITIPNGVESIGISAFLRCRNLSAITLPDSVESIGDKAFYDCSSLSKITICNPECEIYDSAETIPEAVIIIAEKGSEAEKYALKYDRRFRSIEAIDGIYNNLLHYVKYSDHVEITDVAQTGITEIAIPSEIEGLPVTVIGYEAFAFCSSLSKVTLPDGLKNIGDSAFKFCDRLTEITIPDSVESIDDEAFASCINLSEITIPNSVISIGDSAFAVCENLSDITLPYSLKNIGISAFSFCPRITEITIPYRVESIGECAFEGTNLSEITICNPECIIYDSADTIPETAAIIAEKGSTAEKYALKYDRTIQYASSEHSENPAVKLIFGDANDDLTVDLSDVVHIMLVMANPSKYSFTEQGLKNADCCNTGDGITNMDALAIQRYLLGLIPELPEKNE